jgi:hypothetical protein
LRAGKANTNRDDAARWHRWFPGDALVALHLLAMAYPVVMVLVAMSTANHYLADAVAGLVVLLLGHAVSTTPTRIARRVPCRTVHKSITASEA